jgi:hypothetical protein
MTKLAWGRVAAAGLLTLGIVTTAPSQGNAPVDPWTRIPATPTSCFSDGVYDASVVAAEQALIGDLDRQTAINAKVQEEFAGLDMMVKAQKMQQWMMKNPQAAAKMLGGEAAAGKAGLVTLEDANNAAQRLHLELDAHKKALDAAIDRALAPVLAREEAHIQAKTQLFGEAQLSYFTTAADYAAYIAIVEEKNTTLATACAPFFGTGGHFHRWLSQYRSQVAEPMATLGEVQDASMMLQLSIMDTPAGGYRPTAGYTAVRSYLNELTKVTHYRRPKATPRYELARR